MRCSDYSTVFHNRNSHCNAQTLFKIHMHNVLIIFTFTQKHNARRTITLDLHIPACIGLRVVVPSLEKSSNCSRIEGRLILIDPHISKVFLNAIICDEFQICSYKEIVSDWCVQRNFQFYHYCQNHEHPNCALLNQFTAHSVGQFLITVLYIDPNFTN